MEENELEEGEAYSGQEDDDATIDPDIALSYIDEKIQNVLGHFQKDFEGGVCAENLGAKFGGYGSFLPAHQRSPSVISQTRSPPKTLNFNPGRSPCHPQPEGALFQKIVTPANAAVPSKNSGLSTSILLDNSGKRDSCVTGPNKLECSPQHSLIGEQINCNDQKALKVRVKVGPEKRLCRDNAAIYSGLGLDASSSPSLGESFDDSRGSSPESHDSLVDSPMMIYKFYSCLEFSVLDSYKLSPISKSLLYMTEKDMPQLKECQTGDHTVIYDSVSFPSSEAPMLRNIKSSLDKITKPNERNCKPFKVKKSNIKDGRHDISAILKRKIDIETTVGRGVVTGVLYTPLLSPDGDVECPLAKDSVKAPGISQPSDNTVGKDKILPTDVTKEDQGSINSKSGNGGNEHSHIKTKLNVKPLLVDKLLEDRKFGITRVDITNGSPQKGKTNFDKRSYNVKADCEENKVWKDQAVVPVDSVKLKARQRAIPSAEDEDGVPQGKDRSSSGRRKSKGGESNDVPSSKFYEDTSVVGPMMKNDKKKNLQLKGDLHESNSKSLKSQKIHNKMPSRERDSSHGGPAKVEQTDDRIDYFEFVPGDVARDFTLESKKEETFSIEKIEKTGSKNLESIPTVEPSDKVSLSAIPTSTVTPPSAPHVIEEHWVCCDKCEKWRLLPNEIHPSQLPSKWKCNMLYWLPGMNKCNVTEEETTKALLALYNPPVAEGLDRSNFCHVATSLSAVTTGSQLPQKHDFGQHVLPCAPEKKISQKDAAITSGQLCSVKSANSSRENQQIHIQNGSTDNWRSKPKEKNRKSEQHSDGGDSFEQGGKHSKSKSRREFDQDNERDFKRVKVLEAHRVEDNERDFKRVKVLEAHRVDEDCNSNHSLGGKNASISVCGLPSKASGKNPQNFKEFTNSKNYKFDQKEKSPASRKSVKAPVHIIANGRTKEQLSSFDSEKSDTEKKRKVKNWQEGGVGVRNPQTTKEDSRKDKKARVSKSDGWKPSAGKTDAQLRTAEHVSGVPLPRAGQDQSLDGVEESRGYTDKDQLSQRNAECPDSSLKKEPGSAQPSTAANSSSSKVSGSRKNKANFQEVRDSPVESVSSSPLRVFYSDTLHARQNLMVKDDPMHVGYSVMGSPRRSSEGEADGICKPIQAKVMGLVSTIQNGSLEINRAAESSVMDPKRGASDLKVRKIDANKAKDQLFTKIFGHADDGPSPSDNEEINGGDGVAVTPKSQHKHNSQNQGRGLGCVQDKLDNHYHVSSSNNSKKSGKSSSSRSRERHKSSKTDRGKMKMPESFNDKEGLHTRKNDDHVRHSTAMDSSGHYKSHENKDNSLEKKEQKSLVKICGSRSNEGKRDSRSNALLQENAAVHVSPSLANKNCNLKVTEPPTFNGNRGKSHVPENLHMSLLREDERSSSHILADHMDKSKMDSGRGKLDSAPHPCKKDDSKNQASHPVPFSDKGSRSDMVPGKAENGGMVNGLKHLPKIESQNEANHNSLRNLIPNGLDGIGSARKESGPPAILKEARDLKHTANRLKNEGLVQESTGLYFQAALKFLHVALLFEKSESAKNGDMTPSIQMYSDTAKLCEFCAHEYEKHKQVAASALAYKCMEVAYMKVVYFKYSFANKDRHELQIVPQMVLHGESPSSSASDVDNLINSNMIEKMVSVKGVNSPQIAGNHIIAARHRPNFMRLLGYVDDVTSAMEASKKSVNAFSVASTIFDGPHRVEAMLSVRKALDFSFHDVEGLLRLVRVSVDLVSS